MKLVSQEIEKDGTGRVTVIPNEPEDFWHLYNLIHEGDTVKMKTFRKVQKETAGGTGGTSERKVLNLVLKVIKVEYDALGGYMRISGTNMTTSEWVSLGAHHSGDVELNAELSIGKDIWDKLDHDVITEACDETLRADVAAVTMQEGYACMCLVTNTMCIVKAKIEGHIPKKRRGGASQHDKALNGFFDKIIAAIVANVRWDIVKVVVVGSPGFLRDDFLTYMALWAVQNDCRDLILNKSKFVPCTLSSGFKHSLKEAFTDPELSKRLADTKAARESRAMESFFLKLNEDPDCVTYGTMHVAAAVEKQVVDVLMISDALFHCHQSTRKMYIGLMEGVEAAGGTVLKFSSLHVTGEQLNQLTGMAALLRYPCPELDDIEEVLRPIDAVVGTAAKTPVS